MRKISTTFICPIDKRCPLKDMEVQVSNHSDKERGREKQRERKREKLIERARRG
jgi:predicted metal-binding transcription factor (methanogenesis marker protein 9)